MFNNIISDQQQIDPLYLQRDCLKQMTDNELPLSNGTLSADGQIHRYSVDNKTHQPDEWYTAFEGLSQKGTPYLCCIYGSWTTGAKFEYKSWEQTNGYTFSTEEISALKQSSQKAKEKADQERIEKYQLARERAKEIWNQASKESQNEQHKAYLRKKQIEAFGEVRFGMYGDIPSMLIPLKEINGSLSSLQFIWVNSNGKTEKRFLSNGKKRGCFMELTSFHEADHLYICEGYATGASIQQVVNDPVIIAFDAGNLSHVVQVIKEKYPSKKITLCADNDPVGIKKAQDVSKRFNCTIIAPQFPEDEKELSDFNDLFCLKGKDELKRQLLGNHEPKQASCEEIQNILETLDEDPCKELSMKDFPPVLKTYIESLSETTEAHPIMIIMSVICSISAMVGKRVYMKEGEGKTFQNLYPNIWSLCITKSGGFKTTALNKGSEIALEEDRKILQMMKDIEDRDTEYNPLDDRSKLDAKLQAEVLRESLKRPLLPTRVTSEFLIKYLAQGHKGMILSSEMGEWLKNLKKNHNGDLKELFTYFYDVDIAPYEQRTKHCGGGIVETPFITINSVSTIDWIQKEVKEEDIFSGFFARILLFAPPANDNIPPARPQKRKKSPEEEKTAKKKIADTLENLGELTFSFSEESGVYFGLIHSSLYQMVQCSKYDDRCQKFLEPYLKRWSPYVIKLAMIFRILEDPLSEELSVSSIKSATEIIKVAIKSTAKLFEKELGESVDQRKQRLVFDWILKRTTLKITTKLKHILKSRQLEGGSKEYEEVLETLENAGKVECSNPKTENKKDREYVAII